MRHTRQRTTILDILQRTDTHPTADWVFAEARKTLPKISLGTVYRTLDLLIREHQVCAIDIGDRKRHYDRNNAHHAHIICRTCGKILDFDLPLPESMTNFVAASTAFDNVIGTTEWHGTCPDCQPRNV